MAERLEETSIAWDAATGPEHWLDENRRKLVAVCLDEPLCPGDVVVRRDDEIVRHVGGRPAAHEAQNGAVVAALEHEDLPAPGERGRCGKGHQVRLGSRIREPHKCNGRKSLADYARELGLDDGMPREIDAVIERRDHGGANDLVRMAKDAGGELAQHVDVLVAVEIPEAGARPPRRRAGGGD